MANYPDSALAEFLRTRRMRAQESNKKSIGMGTMKSSESAELLAQFDAAVARLDLLARLSPLQQQFLALVLRIDPATPAAKAPVAPASQLSGTQWQRLTRLLNHPCFSKDFRSAGLLKVGNMSADEATAYIAELEANLPSAEQVEAVEALFTRSCFTLAAREQGQKRLAELCRAGAASYISALEKLATELEAGLATASTPAQASCRPAELPQLPQLPQSTHPALVASPYEQARAAYVAALQSPHIKPEERAAALEVLGDFSEAQLRTKTTAMQQEITRRAMLTPELAEQAA